MWIWEDINSFHPIALLKCFIQIDRKLEDRQKNENLLKLLRDMPANKEIITAVGRARRRVAMIGHYAEI